jgi:hypothetical protein
MVGDALRKAVKTFAPTDAPRLTNDFALLYADADATLRRLATKLYKDPHVFLTRMEMAFIAERIQYEYAVLVGCECHIVTTTVKANLKAFTAFMNLRDYLYPDDYPGDNYYQGNLGTGSCDGSIVGQAQAVCSALTTETIHSSQAGLLSRNLAVALRQEPSVPDDLLNEEVGPYMPTLLKALLYMRYLRDYRSRKNGAKPFGYADPSKAVPENQGEPVKVGDVAINIIPIKARESRAMELSMLIEIGSTSQQTTPMVTLNNSAQILDFSLLLRVSASSTDFFRGDTLDGRFGIVRTPTIGDLKQATYLDVNGCRLWIGESLFSDMVAAMKEALARPSVAQILTDQSLLYGSL